MYQTRTRRSFRRRITKSSTFFTPNSVITVCSSTRRRLQQSFSRHAESSEDHIITHTVTLIPRKKRHRRFALKASFLQTQAAQGFWTVPPSIVFSPILPNDSPVFQYILDGEMDEFLRLLRSGGTWLQARDENGTSLLHVSLHLLSFPAASLPTKS